MSPPVLLAVDGPSLVHRNYHAQKETDLRTPDGWPVWATRGAVLQILAAVDRIGAGAVVVGWDSPINGRRDRYPEYKAGRPPTDLDLARQLRSTHLLFHRAGVLSVERAGWEADDIIASAARRARERAWRTVVLTSDRDALSLVDESWTRLLLLATGGVDKSPILDPAAVVEKAGVRPDQYLDYAALRGDQSDNLPGVGGIGEKRGRALLAEFDKADEIWDAPVRRVADALGGPGHARALLTPNARAEFERNRDLMRLNDRLDIGLTFQPGSPGVLPLDPAAVRYACELTRVTSIAGRVSATLTYDPKAAA